MCAQYHTCLTFVCCAHVCVYLCAVHICVHVCALHVRAVYVCVRVWCAYMSALYAMCVCVHVADAPASGKLPHELPLSCRSQVCPHVWKGWRSKGPEPKGIPSGPRPNPQVLTGQNVMKTQVCAMYYVTSCVPSTLVCLRMVTSAMGHHNWQ